MRQHRHFVHGLVVCVLAALALPASSVSAGAQQPDRLKWTAGAGAPLSVPMPEIGLQSHAGRLMSNAKSPLLVPRKPSRSSRGKHLLIGAGVGALVGSVTYLQIVRNRCTDCWSIPQVEVPVFVGGGALAGYLVGGAVFYLRVAPKRGD